MINLRIQIISRRFAMDKKQIEQPQNKEICIPTLEVF